MRISDWSSDVCSRSEFAKEHSVSGTRLVNSIFTLGLVVGVGVSDVSNGTTVGNLGFKDISFPAPVSIGDTLRAETEVLSKRESKSRPNAGIVEFRSEEHTYELQSLMRISYAVFCLKTK